MVIVGYFFVDFPAGRQNVSGTVVPAQRYRAEQIQAGDVKLGDQAVAQLMQTESFERLVRDPKLRAMAQDPAFQALARKPEALAALTRNADAVVALSRSADATKAEATKAEATRAAMSLHSGPSCTNSPRDVFRSATQPRSPNCGSGCTAIRSRLGRSLPGYPPRCRRSSCVASRSTPATDTYRPRKSPST